MKAAIWTGMAVGSTIGGFVPMLWGDSAFSFTSLLLSSVGAAVGIYVAFKLTH